MTTIAHPIPYQGSKRRLAPIILEHFPKRIDVLYEPFVGSAAVSLAAASRDVAKSYVLGEPHELRPVWQRDRASLRNGRGGFLMTDTRKLRQTFRLDNECRPIRERQVVPKSFVDGDALPHITPVVGDVIAYETWAGDPVHRDDAYLLMKQGRPVFYTTWEEID